MASKLTTKGRYKKAHKRNKSNEPEESGLLSPDDKIPSVLMSVSLENESKFTSQSKSVQKLDEAAASLEEKERLLSSPSKSALSDDSITALDSLTPLIDDVHISPCEESDLEMVDQNVSSISLVHYDLPPEFQESAPEYDGFNQMAIEDDARLAYLTRADVIRSDDNNRAAAPQQCLDCVQELKENSEDFDSLCQLSEKICEVEPLTESQLSSIYRNEELEMIPDFLKNFLDSELKSGTSLSRHPLYIMLMSYLKTREKRTHISSEIYAILSECEKYESRLWTLESVSVTENGECQDGNPVQATHEYQVGTFDRALLSTLAKSLVSIRELVNDDHTLASHNCEVTKLQIEHYLYNIIAPFVCLPPNYPVSLSNSTVSHKGEELHAAISVLFSFIRIHNKDSEVVAEVRSWLTFLVSILLRIANWQSHLFILSHLLRCPSGVSKWAKNLVQIPLPTVTTSSSAAHLNHMIATLAVFISPVAARDQFLPQSGKSMEDSDEIWVVIDSEGEDEEDVSRLSENDLIAFFNQVPLDALFKQVLQMSKKEDDMIVPFSSSQILRIFAIMKVLLKVFKQGLTGNDSSLQLAKRLATLVNHTVQYATDIWDLFIQENSTTQDKCLLERLQSEYDDILMNACSYLLMTPFKTSLQFLASMPFKMVSLPVLWKIYCMIFQPNHQSADYPSSILQFWACIEELFPKLSDDELYYILNCASNMAISRSITNDWVFIKMVTIQLLQIGYLNTTTRDKSFKTVRTLLSNLTLQNPALLSVLLSKMKMIVSRTGHLSIYLFKELPIYMWIPDDNDLAVLEYWLLFWPVGTPENNLARFIFSNINWGYHPDSDSELFIAREVHCRVGFMVLKAAVKYCPETVNGNNSSVLTETVKQLTNTTMGKSLSSEQSMSMWAWEMLFRLRIHLLDQPDSSVWQTLNNPMEHFSRLPSLETATTEMTDLSRALTDKQVCALYLTMVLTSEGHSIPLICNNGFSYIASLVQCHRYIAAINLIQYIFPLFIDCQQSLLSSEPFLRAMQGLVVADKTFIRMAKNLIVPAFPGLVMSQFGDMIQYLLENYRKYNQSSPIGMVHLWLRILCKVWTVEPSSVSYLLDIILRVAFFRSEIKNSSSEILCELFQTVANSAKSSSKFSLSNWVSSSSLPSLVPRSAPDTPWFAFYVLEIEEMYHQTRNSLWKHLLLELAGFQGKANIDSSLKKCCNTLKIPVVSSGNLSLFRWSQQALDTPVDHPLLPLIWQKFFILYLARVPVSPGSPEIGCVGGKFFEGLTNMNYLKKVKRKLRDCKDYYEAKCANTVQVVSEDRKIWLNNMAKLYGTYSLWLEEPRLHDPGIYLPSLPPQYDPYKLSKIFSSDSGLWYEYIDYENVRLQQKDLVTKWEKCNHRTISSISIPRPVASEMDPVSRITKRLQCYENPISPPPVKIGQPILPPLQPEAFHNKQLLLEHLKASLKTLVLFAQTASMNRAEHTSLDCTLLEILPILYQEVEMDVKLFAACDTVSPNSPRPPPEALNCAGPAAIVLKVKETKLNSSTEVAIKNNRMEMYTNVKRMLLPPPDNVIVSSCLVEQVVQDLEKEWQELNKIGDVELMNSLRDCGSTLFYHLTSMCSDEIFCYTPLKKLVSTCVDILGQAFVSGDEKQAPVLLSNVLESPSLSSLLASHFEPANSSPPTYIQLYQCLLSAPQSIHQDLMFVLLTKFEMGQWLVNKKPLVSERSQLIDMVITALAKSGQTPSEDGIMTYEVLRRHLCVLMMYDPPTHYAEVISLLLKNSESHCMSTDVWYDAINAITSPFGSRFRPHMPLANLCQETVKYASLQTILSFEEVCQIIEMVAGHFDQERLQYGLYGLYPKYRAYVSPVTVLLSVVGHLIAVTILHGQQQCYTPKVSEQVWQALVKLYSPWISPYFTQSLTQPTAAWIQQLTDDRSVLLPWIAADSGFAHKLTAVLTETLRFILDILPNNGEICSNVWQYYVMYFAHPTVKDHVLTVIHSNICSLPWNRFYPSLNDLDLMLKVADTYVPLCHSLLGAIFIDIPWSMWIHKLSPDNTVGPKVYNTLLHLLIKLANEPYVRQSPKILKLLDDCHNFPWDFVDNSNYEAVVNWFVMSYDPRVIFKQDDEAFEVDYAVLELLRVSAGYLAEVETYSVTTPKKRQIYVRACAKLIMSSASKHKTLLTTESSKIELAVNNMISQIEDVVPKSGIAEAGYLLSETAAMLNMPEGHPLPRLVLNAVLNWLNSRGATLVASALCRISAVAIAKSDYLGSIVEASLNSVFSDANGPDWAMVKCYIQEASGRHPPIEDVLLSHGQILALYSFLIKKISPQPNEVLDSELLQNLANWISLIKPSDDVSESKLVLLLHLILYLASRLCDGGGTSFVVSLEKIILATQSLADFKPSWGLLGAIGLKKHHTISCKFRLTLRWFALVTLNQLPTRKGDHSLGLGQFIRTTPHSPGSLTSSNAELVPRDSTLRLHSQLEEMASDKSYSSIASIIELARKTIELPEHSMHDAHKIFLEVTSLLYNNRFLNVDCIFNA